MCFGESAADTLGAAERSYLQAETRARLPGYGAQAHVNAEAMAWMVIAPQAPTMPRFTICRIDPGLVVMVEDASRRRRFCGMASVEEAIGFVCRTAGEATCALHNVHAAPAAAQ